jgi:hypothetical protein
VKLFLFIKQRANIPRGILAEILNSFHWGGVMGLLKETFTGDSVSLFKYRPNFGVLSFYQPGPNRLLLEKRFLFTRIADNF